MLCEEFFVHRDADPRRFQRPHIAVAVDLIGRTRQLIAEQIVARHIALEISAIIDRGENVNRRRHVQAGHAECVRIDRQLVGGGHPAMRKQLGDAAGLGDVGLQDRDRAILDHAAEFEAGEMIFARRERDLPEARRQLIAAVIRAAGTVPPASRPFSSSMAGITARASFTRCRPYWRRPGYRCRRRPPCARPRCGRDRAWGCRRRAA